MRTTERIRRVDPEMIEYRITINDPETYTAPFTVRTMWTHAAELLRVRVLVPRRQLRGSAAAWPASVLSTVTRQRRSRRANRCPSVRARTSTATPRKARKSSTSTPASRSEARRSARVAEGCSRDTPEDRPWGSSAHIAAMDGGVQQLQERIAAPVRRRSREQPSAPLARAKRAKRGRIYFPRKRDLPLGAKRAENKSVPF